LPEREARALADRYGGVALSAARAAGLEALVAAAESALAERVRTTDGDERLPEFDLDRGAGSPLPDPVAGALAPR